MSLLLFSDGIAINTSGPLRVLQLADGYYVVGQGCLIPVDTEEAARSQISYMERNRESDYIDFEEC